MFDPMSDRWGSRVLFAALVALSLNASAPGAGHQPPKPVPQGTKFSDPVVLIVAFDGYADPKKKLKYPVASGIAFAKEIAKQGYRVTFVTDKGSAAAVKKALGKAAKDVLEVDDATTLDNTWRTWMEDHFLDPKAPAAALGIVAFIGHAVERSDAPPALETYFLTPKDDETNGGILIQNIQGYCNDRNLPIVMLMNVCRSSPPKKHPVKDGPKATELVTGAGGRSPTTLLVLKDRGNRFGFSEEGGTPLTYWASHPGEPVLDVKQNMLALLARGLEEIARPNRRIFVAKQNASRVADGFWPVERDTDLSFLRWFRYGLEEDNVYTENHCRFTVDPGKIEQQMIFASTEKGRLARLLALNNSRVDLLGAWSHSAGEFTEKRTDRGIEITHPLDAKKVRYSLGVLKSDESARGKTLLIECMALKDDVQGSAGAALSVLVQPGEASGRLIYSGWDNRPVSVLYNRLKVVAIPLDLAGANTKLNRITFSADPMNLDGWPKGAALLVTRMQLCDTELVKEVEAPGPTEPLDLMSRWWIGDVLREDKSDAKMLVEYKSTVNARLTLKLEAKDAAKGEVFGRGGPVFPKPYVDKRVDVVVIQLSECGLKKNTRFEIVLHGKTKVLAEQVVEVAPGQLTKPIVVELKGSDFLDYIGITSSDPGFKANMAGLSIVVKDGGSKR